MTSRQSDPQHGESIPLALTPSGVNKSGAHHLPKGAAPPLASLSLSLSEERSNTPPGTPSQGLLEVPSSAQYANYPDPPLEKKRAWIPVDVKEEEKEVWVPYPLRTWFWATLVIVLAGGAIGLEVALHYSKRNLGWPVSEDADREASLMHYVYTLPPVAVAAVIVAMWAWTDFEIKKLQPYVDLVHGDSPPHRSLLLDYTRTNNFLVWTYAAFNKHWVVALASLMVVLSLTFQPLAAALLVVRDTYIQEPDSNMNTLSAVGLNQNEQFQDLTSFLTAAGYASAAVLYGLHDPPFIHQPYTIAPFQLPRESAVNGTAIANTTAVRSETGCTKVHVDMVRWPDGGGWNNSVTHDGCFIAWQVDRNATTLFGTDSPDCSDDTPMQFRPVIFWFFTYQPSAKASATICYPSISLWDVQVEVDLVSGNVTTITELQPFTPSSNFSQFSGNVTGEPLNGRAYNGIHFDLDNPNRFVIARQDATRLQLPAAVYQAAVQTEAGLVAAFDTDHFADLSNKVYGIYLTLVAREVYFLEAQLPITMHVKTVRKRVWLRHVKRSTSLAACSNLFAFPSDTSVHLLTAALLVLATSAVIIQLLHREERRNLRLKHEPGTIASAVSIGAQTGIGELLAGRQRAKDINEVLQDKKFRIDPATMRIIMEGEDGYDHAASPMSRRKSIFAALQNQRRFSAAPQTPKSGGQV
ncbi:hypothetical protein AX16_002496 [Volvariella volvacea WC 439]|nr:hypothetical protein AX16_002496 [Volvariella volvacea WC 439]